MMLILNGVVDLLNSFFNLSFLRVWFFPMIALCFIVSIPAIIRVFTSWR